MTRSGGGWSALLVALVALLSAQPREAQAHALAPSLLTLEEKANGEIEVLWRTPLQALGGGLLRPLYPAGCEPAGASEIARDETRRSERLRLRCAPGTLTGSRVGVEGLDVSGTNVLLRVHLADGRQLQALLSAHDPAYEISLRPQRPAVVASFFGLGVEHLATGFDHLLFVAGLVLLLRGGRRLVAAITAFTAGHSVTLALAALGIVRFPAVLVEVGIAASLVLLGREIGCARVTTSPGLLARRPWMMAFGFGLLHGLGFAGALREAGLPPGEVPLALLGFNLGIEAGQLALVTLLIGAALALRPLPPRLRSLAPRLTVEAIGILGVFLCLERMAGALSR